MRKSFVVFLLSGALLLVAGGSGALAKGLEKGYKGYPRGNALISVQELKSQLDARNSKVILIAAANDLEYRTGHIPGAYQVDRKEYEAPADSQNGVSGNLADVAAFTALATRLGINRDSTVVVYDAKYDATRLWWAFYYYGKTDVRVLDGGVKAWQEAGYSVDILATPPPRNPGNFQARVKNPRLRVETSEIAALQGKQKAQLWDTREWKEFTGDELKKGASRPGRIPWSQYGGWTVFKQRENQAEWLTAAELKTILAELGFDESKEQYFYCQSGVRSTQVLFALYLSGWPVARLHNYDSSWIGWSRENTLPVALGPPVRGYLVRGNE